MSEERTPVSIELATEMMTDGEYVHTFMSAPGIMIGADVSRETLLKRFAENGVELSGEMATAMKHGLVYFDEGKPIFVATKGGG